MSLNDKKRKSQSKEEQISRGHNEVSPLQRGNVKSCQFNSNNIHSYSVFSAILTSDIRKLSRLI